MEVSKAMIQRFLENRCTKEEADEVYQYLLNNRKQLDEWLSEQEWESFEATRKLNIIQSNSWFNKIEEGKEKQGMRIASRQWLRIAAAGLVAVSSLIVYQLAKAPSKKTIVRSIVPQVPENKEKLFRNNGKQPVSYTLDDGSNIILYANSVVICDQPFDSTKRMMTLHGEGLFHVAKDPSRPFTVLTKGFSTTALGTTFRIKAYDSSGTSTVKLIEGKVVLQNLQSPEKPIYLVPGDEYIFNHNDNRLRNWTHKANTSPKVNVPIQVDGSITETDEEISFSNTPLPEVMKKISETYKISIDTDSAKLEGRKFTGSFLKKQTAGDVLATIAGLNNYTVVYEGAVYRLTVQ